MFESTKFNRVTMAIFDKDLTSSLRQPVIVPTGDVAALDGATSTTQTASGRGGFYRTIVKRAIDLALTVGSIPLWGTAVALGAAVVALDGHNPFYSQKRIGKDGRVFRMWKLRSMVPNADAYLESYLAGNPEAKAEWDRDQKLQNDPRITRVGKLIRKTSLDELPQLINVVTGDMSLVGPRPIMTNQKALYPGRRYYDMRPGLTGLWQVSDRNDCSFVGRVRYDNAYHRNMSFGTDLDILKRTVGVVVRGTGV